MVNRDLLLAKINSIQNCLQRVQEKIAIDPQRILTDMDVQDIVVLNIQRAVQVTIDLAAHIVAVEKWGLPKTLKEFFVILQQHQVISVSLADRLQHMVGFRNIAVHDYQTIDPKILLQIAQHHLSDLEEFIQQLVVRYDPRS